MSANFTNKDKDRMQELRYKGFSNMEISEKLKIPYKVVLGAIGKQPKYLPEKCQNVELSPEKKADYNLCEVSVNLSGEIATYEILTGIGVVISVGGVSLPHVSSDELASLIKELEQVAERLR